jgi:hypothetical protein
MVYSVPLARERPIRRFLHVAVHLSAALLALLVCAAGTAAQVDADPAQEPAPAGETGPPDSPAPPRLRDLWDVSAELSLTDQSGNRSLRLWTAGLKFAHRFQDAFRLEGAVSSRYGRSEGELVARSHYGSLAFDFRPRSTWSPFLFTTAEHDPFRRVHLRASGGAGGKYTFFRLPRGDEASISLALLQSHERRTASAEEPRPPDIDVARWSARGRLRGELRPGVTASHTTFFQPLWDEMADYLLRSETGVKLLVTERFAVSVEYSLARTSRPPQGVDPDDRLLKTGFIVNF